MRADRYKKAEDCAEVFRKLHGKFAANFSLAMPTACSEVERVELKARWLASVGELLRESKEITSTQREIATIYDEIFADCVCCVYLGTCGLDLPAQMVLRRVLELGIGVLYLWDLPHAYWGWKQHDRDLKFDEMLDHLASPSYTAYVQPGGEPPDFGPVRKSYRELSNAVHGKLATFETKLQERFQHSDVHWKRLLQQIETVQDAILGIAAYRFSQVKVELGRLPEQLSHI